MKTIINLLLISLLFILCGCQHTACCCSTKELGQVDKKATRAALPLDKEDYSSVRTNDVLKAYPIGRYIDPNNPSIMHEGHVVYRQEAPSAWNTSPNSPIAVPLGPTVAISRPEHHPRELVSEYETKIVQQNQLMEAILSENESLIQMINELKNEIQNLKR